MLILASGSPRRKQLLEDNKETEYGKKYHFSDIHDENEYRKNVPLTTYDDYADDILRMTENDEKNILTTYPVVFYASTSGTSGAPKKIPVTDKGLEIFRKYSSSIMLSVISAYFFFFPAIRQTITCPVLNPLRISTCLILSS